jgi:predicted dehydrogenase
MNKYKAGIIGCGGIGLKHASAYAEMENVELVAGADPSNNRESEYRKLGLKHFYNNASEMLSNENLDLVSVCTNPSQHAPMTILAAESGVKGIICEKPMAKNVKECDAMIDACKRHGVRLAIGHQRRYGEQYIKGHDVIASGMLGEPLLLWAMTPGSDVMTWGVHWLDMFHCWAPDHKAVTVMGQIDVERQILTGHKEFVEDALLGHITYDNGMRAIIECGDIAQLEPGFPAHATIRAYGPKGRFEANDIGYKLSLGDLYEHNPVSSPFERPDYQMWMDQAKELIQCIEQNKEHQCNGYAGRKTIEITCAIWESARSHRLIRLPFESAESPLDAFWRG